MTACNLIVADRAAYLLTDMATYRADGIVTALKTKVVAHPSLGLAMTATGPAWDSSQDLMKSWMGELHSADHASETLPRLVAMLEADRCADFQRRGLALDDRAWPPQGVFRIVVALWSESRRRAEGYQFCTDPQFRPQGRVDLTLQPFPRNGRLDHYLSPSFDAAAFDPERDGLEMLETQRRDYTDPFRGYHTVGGTAQLTIVDESGVISRPLRQWPDEIGRRIEPR